MGTNAKKITSILLVATVLLSAYWLYNYMSNPHAKHNTAIKNILDKFYDAFVREDYQTISGLIDNKNPQMVINVRHWYGEVQKYEILSIQSDGKFEKKAKVRVTSRFNNEERNNIDRISLIKQQDEWFIQSYNSDLDYTLP
ncbi:hypothetical protein [Paenibacillus sp. J2TS4]|uniref:hypothetical protein n=1 Tax=Paenibacillus sp. J2TS4 TaxID=2807194 RepID=UPI001BD08621|nr:hypothetical protein [Paenibacillus sp. J2TS4]